MMRRGTPQTPLGDALAQAIATRGPITFADFMQIALYEPAGGYYTAGAHRRLGWEGDYITSSDLHPLFGAAIGRQLAQIWELMDRPTPFIVQEDGAGRGLLGRDVVAWARERTSDAPLEFADALVYRMRDVSRDWLATEDTTPEAPPHVILSNELIDAFSVHLIERTVDGLAEVYVDVIGTPPTLTERLGPPSTEAVASYLDRMGIRWQHFPVGWRAEVNLATEEWLVSAASRLAQRGVIITIDYGDTARKLYSTERRRGTLLCYHDHQISDDPLALVGEQDITAHVNFTALIATGRAHGLSLAGLTTQRDFLLTLGIRDDAEALGRQRYPLAETERHTDAGQRDYLRLSTLRNAITSLIAPGGLGGFRVLAQQRGLPGIGKRLKGWQAISDKTVSSRPNSH